LLFLQAQASVQKVASVLFVTPNDVPVFLIDPRPQVIYRKITVIPAKACEGMEMFNAFLLENKSLPAYEYKQAEKTDEILLACNQAIYEDPDHPEHWINKSQRLGELKRYDEAMICQDEAMKLLKNN
jgi:tetratricopeptide (TPR) repeat protein